MSSSLYWRPPGPEGRCLGYELKFALREHWGDSRIGDWTTVNRRLIPVLRGIIVGAGKDSELGQQAQELIRLIETHNAVQIKEID